jgi:hypothetical protein
MHTGLLKPMSNRSSISVLQPMLSLHQPQCAPPAPTPQTHAHESNVPIPVGRPNRPGVCRNIRVTRRFVATLYVRVTPRERE